MTDLPPDNLALDCRIAEMLGWIVCKVYTPKCAYGIDPKRPSATAGVLIPSFHADIREVIAVCRGRGWHCDTGPTSVWVYHEIGRGASIEVTTTTDKPYPRAAAEALAGMLEQEKK